MRTVLTAACAFVLAATLACTGKKETPGVVGNQYPHEALDVTGSPYQATDALENRAGTNRDTVVVRGPSLVPEQKPVTPPTETKTDTGTGAGTETK